MSKRFKYTSGGILMKFSYTYISKSKPFISKMSACNQVKIPILSPAYFIQWVYLGC